MAAKINFKRVHPMALTPEKATDGSIGFDIIATSMHFKGSYVEYGTGICLELPPNYAALLMARSSVSKTSLMLANGVGLIDSDYRGEIKVRFKCVSLHGLRGKGYLIGDRIAQLVIVPLPAVEFEEVETIGETLRGDGGFGSTGV